MPYGLTHARAVPPSSVYPTDDTSPIDEAALLLAWDHDICRAASAGARRLRSAVVDADDLAQVARIQLLCAVRRHRITSVRYIRRLIRNAILSALRHEVRRRDADLARRGDLPESLSGPEPEPPDVAARVTTWVAALPDRLRFTYEALYVRELTQRDAARGLRISQPRVAQFHAAILKHGRRAFVTVAA
jgi:RNA polymerase sigma factor (sigma-70 family)